ncbi:MAG TPA: SRPBCC family protein, partial [Candidatus Limnocylindria bacterium]|nr:SRPBCC family protein [Candidatus Limnocylindria bacterium]
LFAARTDRGIEALPGTIRWTIPSNWKNGAENFSGDSYHVQTAHLSAFKAGMLPEDFLPNVGTSVSTGNGFVNMSRAMVPGGRSQLAQLVPPHIMPYLHFMESRREEMQRNLGQEKTQFVDELATHVGSVFPNFSYFDFTQYLLLRVWQPRGPRSMEIWSWVFVEKDMDAAQRAQVRRHCVNQFGPGSVFEQDDADIFTACAQGHRGFVSRQYPLNYQMDLGKHEPGTTPGEEFGHIQGDSNLRAFYKAWVGRVAEGRHD